MYRIGEICSLVLCGLMLFYCIYEKVQWNSKRIIYLGLWFIVTLTYFLPGMHERYCFIGEVLVTIIFLVYKKDSWLFSIMMFNSIITYFNFLGGLGFAYMQILSIVYGVVILLFTKNTLAILKGDIS